MMFLLKAVLLNLVEKDLFPPACGGSLSVILIAQELNGLRRAEEARQNSFELAGEPFYPLAPIQSDEEGVPDSGEQSCYQCMLEMEAQSLDVFGGTTEISQLSFLAVVSSLGAYVEFLLQIEHSLQAI
jgi:hypothetical protein